MLRSILLIVFGVVLGAGGGYVLLHAPPTHDQPAPLPVLPQALSCESELAQKKALIEELEKTVAHNHQHVPREPQRPMQAEAHSPDESDSRQQSISWRVSAIEKFIPLSDTQRERLRDKYQEESSARAEGRESKAEKLEDIVGDEAATTYRQQVRAAFDRVQNQELEKEAVWMSRKLALSAEQEQSMRTIFADVEARVDQELGDSQHGVATSAQERVTRMVKENKRRLELRAEALKNVLSPEQYAAYMQEESQSPAADMEVFHDPLAGTQ